MPPPDLNMLNRVLGQNFPTFEQAESTFLLKYADEFIEIAPDQYENIHREIYEPILQEYGPRMTAISICSVELEEIDGDDESNWLINLLRRNMTSLKKLQLAYLSVDLADLFSCQEKLLYFSMENLEIIGDAWIECVLPELEHFKLISDIRFRSEHFAEFISHNRQIETLDLNTHFNPLNLINGKLNALKQLTVKGWTSGLAIAQETMKFESLESLDIDCIDVIPTLQMFQNDCTNVQKLVLTLTQQIAGRVPIDEDALVNVICSFEKITSLSVFNVQFNGNQMEQLASRLTQLESIHVEMKPIYNVAYEVLRLVPIFALSTTELKIKLNMEMPSFGLNYDYHQQFLSAIVEHSPVIKLSLVFEKDELIFTNEKIFHAEDGSKPKMIHWTKYESAASTSQTTISDLDEKSLWELFDRIDLMSMISLKKTGDEMNKKVVTYMDEEYKSRPLIYKGEENIEWTKIFQTFGKYFRNLNITIPYLCDDTEVFGQINRYCKNVAKIRLVNKSYKDRLINPVQFLLPNLLELYYENEKDICVEASAFAECWHLYKFELKATGAMDPDIGILRTEGTLGSLQFLKMYTKLEAAVELLDNFNRYIYEQLKELRIVTPVHILEANVDKGLAEVIPKFENLLILHLTVPSNYLDTEPLFSNCTQLIEVSILTKPAEEATKTTLQHIHMYCKHLQILNIYRFEDAVPVNHLKLARNLFPNVQISSVQMDEYGTPISKDIVNEEFLQKFA